MKTNVIFLLIISILSQTLNAQDFSGMSSGMSSDISDMEKIRKKISLYYLSAGVNDEHVARIFETMRSDGTWNGINYTDTSRIAFEHTRHLNNLLQLAKAYKSASSRFYGSAALKQSLDKSLNFWLDNDFISENWWHNQIGTPSAMLNLLYLLDNELTDAQKSKALAIAGRANMDASGARPSGDRIKIAALLAKSLLFKRDEPNFEKVMKIIEGEMKLSSEEIADKEAITNEKYFPGGKGMQADFSFHHRADRVNNTLSYGMGFFSSYVEFADLTQDTKYRFTEEKLHLAVDYYLDGVCKQMIFGRTNDPSILNRDVTRIHSAEYADTHTPEMLTKMTDYRRDELENIIRARKGEPFIPASFAKFFWQTEHFVFQRPAFYTSVRMFSTRNRNMEEPYNGEGLTNHYRADGTNYLSLDGNEYLNITPVFDFRKPPGTTVVQADMMPSPDVIQKAGLTDFVGAVTDGLYGAVAFDFKSPHNPLSARKAWFFFDSVYVCLGADISSTDSSPVATTINQCFLEGDVTANINNKLTILPHGKHSYPHQSHQPTLWIHHNNVGYVLLRPADIKVTNRTESGSWFKANKQTSVSKQTVEKDVFCLWIDHGVKPTKATYEYCIMPASAIADVDKFADNQPVKVINNTKALQAVHSSSVAYFVFYEPCKTKWQLADFEAKTPCMVMFSLKNGVIDVLTVSDPSRHLKSVELLFTARITTNATVSSTAEYNEKDKTTKLTINLPQGEYAGKSVSIPLIF